MRRIEEQLATLNDIANQTLGFARTSHSPQQVRLSTLAEAAFAFIRERCKPNKSIS